MQKEFVTYKIALALKELGFNESCFAVWNQGDSDTDGFCTSFMPRLYSYQIMIDDSQKCTGYCNSDKFKVAAPLWQQAIDWFRTNHNLNVSWELSDDEYGKWYSITINNRTDCDESLTEYEKARKQAILKAIELIKKENKYDN